MELPPNPIHGHHHPHTILFFIGPLDGLLASDAPYLSLFQDTCPNLVVNVLKITPLTLILIGNVTALATTSRELCASSRDKGLSCSKWVSQIFGCCFSTKATHSIHTLQAHNPISTSLDKCYPAPCNTSSHAAHKKLH